MYVNLSGNWAPRQRVGSGIGRGSSIMWTDSVRVDSGPLLLAIPLHIEKRCWTAISSRWMYCARKKSDRHDDNYILNKITNIILIVRKILCDVPVLCRRVQDVSVRALVLIADLHVEDAMAHCLGYCYWCQCTGCPDGSSELSCNLRLKKQCDLRWRFRGALPSPYYRRDLIEVYVAQSNKHWDKAKREDVRDSVQWQRSCLGGVAGSKSFLVSPATQDIQHMNEFGGFFAYKYHLN